jgi:cytochrome P450
MSEPVAYNPFDPRVIDDPYPVYRRLRDEAPVFRNDELGFWALSRFEDVLAAAHDPRRFTNGGSGALTGHSRIPYPNLAMLDDPRHGQLRALLSRAFSIRPMASHEGRIRQLTREMVGAVAGAGRVDVMAAVAVPLPAAVIGDLLGLEPERWEQFRRWADDAVHQDLSDPASVEAGRQAHAHMVREFHVLVDERRRAPTDDMLSDLVRAEVAGERLTDEEIIGFCQLLWLAGSETTSNVVGNGLLALAAHPDARAAVVAEPARIPAAIEEMLRWDPPTHGLARTTSVAVDVQGVTIPAGDRVYLLWASANRDEREFPDPDRFDIDRRIDRHLAFGHGIHFCLGAALARLEARVVFEELLAVMPDYTVAEERIERRPSTAVRGPTRLTVEFTPTAPARA